MKLHHIAINTPDLEQSRAFYIRFFGAESNEGYHNPKTGLRTYFLRLPGGALIELMQWPGATDAAMPDKYAPGPAHLAIELDSEDAVEQLTEDIVSAGHALFSAPRRTGDGYYESCVVDPAGALVELVAKR